MKIEGKNAEDKKKQLDEFLQKGRKYRFRLDDNITIEAEYDFITVDEDGFVLALKNVQSKDDDWFNSDNMMIDVETIVNAEER